MNRPLISFILVCYNQEPYIQEAIEGALAQTYSPLEIIITDDRSTDRSFEIIQQVVAEYKGPHTVRACQTPKNVGIGGNINMAMEMCRGEFVVGSAGDDVSLPERTEITYQAWENSGRRATSIFSCYTTITSTGQELGMGGIRGNPADAILYRPQRGSLAEFLSNKWPVVVGCTHAWSPTLFKYFGPLTSDLEDLVLSFRTLAIGELLYVHRPLIKYRRHDTNVSFFACWDDTRSFDHREKRLRWVDEKTTGAYDNMLADADTLLRNGRISADEHGRLRIEGRRVRDLYNIERRMMDGNFFERWRIVAGACLNGNVRAALHVLPRTLPRSAYRALFLLRQRWKSAAQVNAAFT
jgi:glycosyltransferase involved in cell wall biosynthesis